MARRARGSYRRKAYSRGFKNYIRGNVDEVLQLGTLASRTLVAQVFDESVEEKTYLSSVKATWTLSKFSPAVGIGPIMVGLAHSDYSAAEIEQFIENTGSWKQGDLINQEIGQRRIRVVGVFDTPVDAGDSAVLNDGKPIRTKLGWILTTGQTVDQWAYNLGTAAVATTDPAIHLQGKANLWPR